MYKVYNAKLQAAKPQAAKLQGAKLQAAKLQAAKLQAAMLQAAKLQAAKPAVAYSNNEQAKPIQIEKRIEVLYKHPLQNTWTFWYLEYEKDLTWAEMQNEITSFDSVEDFWSVYNRIKPPSELLLGSDYSVFKQGVRPMWEDDANKQGGRWIIKFSKHAKTDLDNIWLDLLLCLMGERFDHNDEICGAVVNIRKYYNKVCVWTANAMNSEAILEIGKKLSGALCLNKNMLKYYYHKDTMIKTGFTVKVACTV